MPNRSRPPVPPGIITALSTRLTPSATARGMACLHSTPGVSIGRPPFGATLSDADIANIIDYERSSWGNHGTPVTAAQVAAERAKGK